MSAYQSRLGVLKAMAVAGAVDKEMTFDKAYENLNIRSFYSSYGPRLKCVKGNYLLDFFDRSRI
jgi:hypothetical protein